MTGPGTRDQSLIHYPGETLIRPLSDKEFALFQAFVLREAGIYLSEMKKALLVGRLTRRLRELGLNSFGEYYRLMQSGDGRERVIMLDLICTNETYFFREPRQFEFLDEQVYPRWLAEAASGARPKHIRAWSAGCSTGEEPFSIAMSLLSRFPADQGWKIEILATDLSTKALSVARGATWSIERSKGIPASFLRRFMLKGTRSQEGKMKAGAEVRSVVQFQRLNLNDEAYSAPGPFDLIFCRNVLIYFNSETRRRTVNKLLSHLSPGGYFLLGHAESLNRITDRMRCAIPTVYFPVATKA
ncbi:MAG TPA: CheR family methyltransferase [Blastocatellia bacterium]|nr:CheR family methyltransferase [Blastocatellia bacterium]